MNIRALRDIESWVLTVKNVLQYWRKSVQYMQLKKTKTVWEILIHSLRTVSSDKFITSANASSPQMTIQYFLFQIPDTSVSLTSPTSCVPLIPRLSVPSIFPFLPRFRKQSLRTIFFFNSNHT